MKTRLLAVAYAVGGILVAFALTMGGYVLAGRELSRPVGPVRIESGRGLAPGDAKASPEPNHPTPSPAGDGGEDVPGPCDEQEHADDPECAGGGSGDAEPGGGEGQGDSSGPGSGGSADSSGPGSGDGGGGDGGDSSGPGSGGSDDSDSGSDNSGSGSDNSGSGSSGSGGDD